DDQSLYDEDVLEKILSNPLFEEEIISMKIDQHHDNAESNLIESVLNHDSSIISSSSKIDSLLDEFAGKLTLLKSIPPGIDETDCDPEEEIRLIERLFLLHLAGSQLMLKSSYKAEASVIISIPPFVGGVADVVVEIKGTVVKAFQGQEGGFGLNDNSSTVICSEIVGSSNYLHSDAILPNDSIRFQVGFGTLFRLEQEKDCLISDRVKDNQWTWNWSRSIIRARNSAYINDIINEISITKFSSERDVYYWTIANDGMYSLSSTRQHIDSHFLLALGIPTERNKTIP
nr:RNA-directed DNA polymerase, eukaryota [Tanacetum cinerariifolium]